MTPGLVDELYRDERGRLFAIAYRMLGSVADAEDLVQEAFLRLQRADADAIANPQAFLTTALTRLAIDRLRSARVRRERYPGPWLPEPLLADAADVAEEAATAESISMAFLVLLERLSPIERAVFLLREAFDYGYAEIAETVGRSAESCRQIALRARRHVEAGRPRFEPSRAARDELARRFMAACGDGDLDALLDLLAEDCVLYGDGGGKAPAFGVPLSGRVTVARAVLALSIQAAELGARFETASVNGQPGARYLGPDGRLISVVALDIADGRVQAVRSIVNPGKLGHLGPLADIAALMASRRRA